MAEEAQKEPVTVVNTSPDNNSGGDNGMGFLVGVVVLILFVFLFFVYGLPYIRSFTANSGVQVNVPERIDINVNQTK